MRLPLKAAFALLLLPTVAQAQITLQQATQQAHDWVIARQDAILNRVEECITENPRLCHTAWAASVIPNTLPSASELATVTLDDPGRLASTSCGDCYIDEGKFAQAGINIPATAPVNAKLNIAGPTDQGWGVQLVIRIRYDGVLYERGYGRGIFDGFAWRVVEEQ